MRLILDLTGWPSVDYVLQLFLGLAQLREPSFIHAPKVEVFLSGDECHIRRGLIALAWLVPRLTLLPGGNVWRYHGLADSVPEGHPDELSIVGEADSVCEVFMRQRCFMDHKV